MSKTKRLKEFLHSLKFQIILIGVFLAVVPGVVLRVAILKNYETRAITIRESEVLSQAKILSNQIATSNLLEGEESPVIKGQIDMLTTIYDGRVLIVDKNLRICHDTYNLSQGRTIISEEVIKSFRKEETMNYDEENRYIEMAIPILSQDSDKIEVLGAMVISVSTDNVVLNLQYLQLVAFIVEIICAVAIIFVSVLLANLMVKPFDKLSDSIEAIQTGYDDSLEIKDFSEFEMICDKFNALIGRMKVMDESRQEFVSNVSHELKTPLTSMKVLADSLNSMPDAPVELYQEFMEDITNEIERETSIINDLLSLVKMDKSASDLNISTININELLESIMKRLQPIADKQQVELVLESFRPVTADVDQVKLTLAFTNLIENAIKYNSNDGEGWVHVSLNADHQYLYLKVEDNGMGIPEESLEHIYERFYRVDKSHSREIGGTGLGLAITRNSILMHRGAIKVYSVLGEGTTFDVRIPLSYIA